MTASTTLRRRLARARRDDRGVVVSQGDVRELLELRAEIYDLRMALNRLREQSTKGKQTHG